jgi:hypothetical protein
MLFNASEPFYFYAKRAENFYDIPQAEGTNCSNLTEMAAPLMK